MSARFGSAARWAGQALLTLGAVVGVVCLLVTISAMLFGLRPLVFQSGSMSPTIATGDLAISHKVDAASLEEGQIVSVPTDTGTRVTHRIVSVDHDGAEAVLVLRGDANKTSDVTPYRVADGDVVLFHVPRLGYVVGWLSSPFGIFLLGLYAAFLVSVLVKRSPGNGRGSGGRDEPLSAEMRVVSPSPWWRRGGSRPRPRQRSAVPGGLAMVLVAGGVVGVAAQQQVTPTLAAWTDTVQVTGIQLKAATAPTPLGLTCTGNGNPANTVTLTWTAVPGATYTVHYGPDGGLSSTASGTSFTTQRNEKGIAWVTATVGTTSTDTVHQPYNHGDCRA